MTELVITPASNTSIVETQQTFNVIVEAKPSKVITSGMMPPPVVNNSLGAIDTTNLQQGSILVYDANTQKWAANNLLEHVIIEQGQF